VEHRSSSTLCTEEIELTSRESNTSYLTQSLITKLPELSTLHCYWNANDFGQETDYKKNLYGSSYQIYAFE